MNIYIENRGTFKNRKVLKQIITTLNEEDFINIHIISEKRVSLLHLTVLSRLPKINQMTLTVPISKLPNAVISFANRNARFNIRLLVNKKISNWHWKHIGKLNGVIEIYDSSNCIENINKYNNNRYVVYKSLSDSNMDDAKIYMLSAGMITDCKFSSCLGKNLYISKNGDISFCPKYHEKSKLGTLADFNSDIYDKEIYYQALQDMIDKRTECQSECKFYDKCQGGCIFEPDCEKFKHSFVEATSDIQKLIEQKHTLDSLVFYKEKSILYKLFCDFE